MTLGDLLRQDGAFSLLVIGAVIGFFVGNFCAFFKKKRSSPSEAAASTGAPSVGAPSTPQLAPAAAFAPFSTQVYTSAVIAAITAAVSTYRNDNLQGERNA